VERAVLVKYALPSQTKARPEQTK